MNNPRLIRVLMARRPAPSARLRRVVQVAWRAALLLLLPSLLPTASGPAQPARAQGPPQDDRLVRELFVPFDALSGILGGENERVFMTRDEYLALEREARRKPPTRAPQSAVLLSASYDGAVRDAAAVIRGTLELDVLDPGLHCVPLSFEGVALRAATLDGAPAPVARNAHGQIALFVRGIGRHRLEVEVQLPVIISAAHQSLQFRLPAAGSSRLQLAVPGNVEVKSGAQVVTRQYDDAADLTRFELLSADGAVTAVLSLNSRRLRADRVVLARSVLVSELTTSYERLHASVEMHVLHGAVDRFLFDVPDGFQITSVVSPLLSQWVIRREGDRDRLEVVLREATRATEPLSIAATRAPAALGAWSMPRLQPHDVAGQVAVIGLLAETRLRPLNVTADGLVRIDTHVLRNALPESVFTAEPGAPAVRPIAAFYAPGEAYALTAALEDPRDELQVAAHLLLVLSEEQQALRGGFTLTPQAAKQTSFAFRMPTAWQLQRVYGADEQPLSYDRYQAGADNRYVVKLPTTVAPGTSATVYFEASFCSSAWLDDWAAQDVEFPHIAVEQVTDFSGAISVQPTGDLTAKPVTIDRLTPLDESQRSRFGLGQSADELAYEMADHAYRAVFRVERTQPHISARNYASFMIREGLLVAHYELVYQIERAHTKRLVLELPATTPIALSIRGVTDDVQVKEYAQTTAGDQRMWTALLAQAHIGTVRLAVDFEQRLSQAEMAQPVTLPLARAADVAYQTQMVSVEGDPALDVGLETKMRPVDVGEFAEAQQMPGRRLLGAFASTTDDSRIDLIIARRALSPLPATIVQRAELVTLVSTAGASQSAARYLLETKIPYLAIQLPAGAELWSVSLDGSPVKPRKRGDQIVLSLQADKAAEPVPGPGPSEAIPVRDLQVVYAAPIADLAWIGRIRTRAPQLRLIQDEQDAGVPVPQVDLVWHLHLPTGYRLSRARGTVFTSQIEPVAPPWQLLSQAGMTVGGRMPRLLARASQVGSRSAALPEAVVPSHTAPRGAEADRYEYGFYQPQLEPGPPFESNLTILDPELPGLSGGTPYGGGMAGMGGMGGMSAGGSMAGQFGMGVPMPGMTLDQPAKSPPDRRSAVVHGGMRDGSVVSESRSEDTAGEPAAESTAEMPDRAASVPSAAPSDAEEGRTSGPEDVRARQDRQQLAKYWALQGLRGVSIQLDQSSALGARSGAQDRPPGQLTFRSLGSDPELDITVYDQGRIRWLAWAVVLAILTAGLLKARAPVRTRVRWVVLLTLLACGLPIIRGPLTEFTAVFEKALTATLALVPLWIVIACVERFVGWIVRRRTRATSVVTTAAWIIAASLLSAVPPIAEAQDIRQLLQPVLDEDRPVRIPDDAVVIPYDPADLDGREAATRVLVPYARYVELWNRAHPDEKIGEPSPEPLFSCAGARYTVTLEEAEHIVLQGTLDIEVLSDKPVDVPLALQRAVITSALLDGKPARLKALQPAPAEEPPQAEPAAAPQPPPLLLALVLEGQGRHRLELAVRVAVTRRGGLRIVSAVVPYAEATAVQVTVPDVGTSVHRQLGTTSLSETTTEARQVIDATLGEGGRFDIAWRAEVAPGAVDQALTATSLAAVDVREDGIHVSWRVDFAFGQTDRNMFRLEVPHDYLVELVEGKNVRGWDPVAQGAQQFLNVELLAAVKQHEQITVHLSRRIVFPPGRPTAVAVPFVAVPDAALHRGTVQIRRSTILELQTTEDQGVARTDSAHVADQLARAEGGFGSPLAVRDYQAYQFTATPFRIALAVSQIQPRVSAELRTLFRLGETEAALESEIRMTVQRRAVYQVRVEVPAELQLDEVTAAGLSDWSITPADGRQTLTAFFSAGQTDRFSLALRGKLSDHEPRASVWLPQIVVRDVDQQQGTLVVQVDTSLDARATALENCRPALLDRVQPWLADGQKALARLALEYQQPDYRGAIALSPRMPNVTCVTVTNVRVTFREVQETILLDFHIAEAGVRQVSFQLPAALRGAHIAAPRVREKHVAPVDGDQYDRVTLDLQDAITGQYRVVVENNRAIAPGRQLAPLPLVDTGLTIGRYVTLENAGRDEVVVDGAPAMEPVARETRQWSQLAARLAGGDFSTAYSTARLGPDVEFGYRTEQRAMLKTAGAAIGLAHTELVLDAGGAYRASLLLKIDNRTEPYLEIELPPGAALWTAHVAGQPVKPAHTAGRANDRLLRIPLIKTAEGDLDFPVTLKYAGTLDAPLRSLRTVNFPLIRTVNINVELSQVKLSVPEDFRWIDFSEPRVTGEDDFAADYLAYRTQQVERLTQILGGADEFSKSRAMYNVKALEREFHQLQAGRGQALPASKLQLNIDSNARALEVANRRIDELQQQAPVETDNRGRLHAYFEAQGNTLVTNEVVRLDANFAQPAAEPAAPVKAEELFDQQWLEPRGRGRTARETDLQEKRAEPDAPAQPPQSGQASPLGRVESDVSRRAQQRSPRGRAPGDDAAAQQVFRGELAPPADQADEQVPHERLDEWAGTKESLKRAYSDKIEQQLAEDATLAQTQTGQSVPPDARGRNAAMGEPLTLGDADTGPESPYTADTSEQVAGRVGLASLDFQLPQRGTTYYFTTPRGNVELSARPINNRLLRQLADFGQLVALVVVTLGGWWLVQQITRFGRLRISNSRREG